MNSCCGSQRSTNLSEEPESTNNCSDPIQVVNEFKSIYCQKIKTIEEKCKNPSQAKIKVLEEWVNDLTEQNRVLIDTMDQLGKEALARAQQVDQLVKDTRENQDVLADSTSGITNSDLKCRVSELEEELCRNEEMLTSCSARMVGLTKALEEKKKECDSLHGQNGWPVDSQKQIKELKCQLQNKSEDIKCLEEQIHKYLEREQEFQEINEKLHIQLEQSSKEMDNKEETIKQLKACLENTGSRSGISYLSGILNETLPKSVPLSVSASSRAVLPPHSNKPTHPGVGNSQEDNPTMDSVQCSLMAQLKGKDKQISNLQMNFDKNSTLLENQRQQLNKLQEELCDLQQCLDIKERKIQELSQREDELQGTICRLKADGVEASLRFKELEQCIAGMQDSQSCLEINSSFQNDDEKQRNCFLESLANKEGEINRHIEDIDRLKRDNYQLNQDLMKFAQQKEQLIKTIKELSCQLKMKENEERLRIQQQSQGRKKSIPGNSDILKLEFKEKQIALAGEVAAKHDEIRNLKNDIKDLEEKLCQSEKQTHFRDDMIKELRKEVKHGRAKESLAEMLGLKGTPRAAMKDRIDNLTGQIDELKALNLSLEARLAECNLPAVLTLRSRLNQAEGSLLAMCNKIDYVRRYLENLKGDEEMSMKCGLEALLSELREDVEWNRQTRRNLSLDEGTSVIVISHRSRSLPDNSLHRISTKSQSDPSIMSNKALAVTTNLPMLQETFHECKNYINTINELEKNFDESHRAISYTWHSLKNWSQVSGDAIASYFSDVIRSSVEGNDSLSRLAKQVGSLLDHKEDDEVGKYTLNDLQGNLIVLANQLHKLNLMESSKDSLCSADNGKPDDFRTTSLNVTMTINDSVSLLNQMKINNNSRLPANITSRIEEIMGSFATIIGHKKKDLEKLDFLQKQQIPFVHTLLRRLSEFDKGLSSYHETSENLKKEIRKLFNVVLSKENQIQKQYDEIQHLKSSPTTTSFSDNRNKEVASLRKVVSNKDLKVTGKDELIHNLRSLNYTLRRNKMSRSSPSINSNTDITVDLDKKLQDLDETVNNIKGNILYILESLSNKHEKVTQFEEKFKSLVQALAETHEGIMSYKNAITDGQGDNYNATPLDSQLSDAKSQVEDLLNAIEGFLYDSKKCDMNTVAGTLQRNFLKLIYIRDSIKRCVEQEQSLMKSMCEGNEEIRKQNSEKENSAIENLKENLKKTTSSWESLCQKYSNLKIQKEDMEIKNQKVMEELQAKISGLQEAASRPPSSDVVSNKSWLFPWPQSRYTRHVHDV